MPDSEKIEEPIEELRARFRLDAPFTYSVAVDVQPPVAWKQPYTGIKARRPRPPRPPLHGAAKCCGASFLPERAGRLIGGTLCRSTTAVLPLRGGRQCCRARVQMAVRR